MERRICEAEYRQNRDRAPAESRWSGRRGEIRWNGVELPAGCTAAKRSSTLFCPARFTVPLEHEAQVLL